MKIKKLSSILLAVVLVFAMTVAALADSGTITINNSSDGTSPVNRTFNAYSILDVTLAIDNTPVYHAPSSLFSFYGTYFHSSATYYSGKTQAWIDDDVIGEIGALNASEMEDFAEAALSAAVTAGITPVVIGPSASASAYQNVAVPYGYYVIDDVTDPSTVSRVSAVMVDTTNPNISISLKADTPSLEKEIVISETIASDSSTGAVGDTVDFKITTKVPNMTGFTYYAFNVADTLSAGLTFDPTSVVVKVDGTPIAANAAGSTTGYHVVTGTEAAPYTFKVIFHDFINYKNYAGDSIVVTYSATINENAVIGINGNTNEAKLIYSNDPSEEGDPDTDLPPDVHGETPTKITKTYVTGIDIKKVDTEGHALTGATFTLEGTNLNLVVVTEEVFTLDAAGTYYKLKDGTYTTTAPEPDGSTDDKYESLTDLYKKETVTSVKDSTGGTVSVSGTVDDSGMLTFNGLKPGDYTLTETVAPSGYNLLANPIQFTISCTLPAAIITGNETCTWHVTGDPSVQEDGSLYIEVENAKGTVLPSTGGIGTTIFTIAGLALMAGAALLLIMRRKAKKATR